MHNGFRQDQIRHIQHKIASHLYVSKSIQDGINVMFQRISMEKKTYRNRIH